MKLLFKITYILIFATLFISCQKDKEQDKFVSQDLIGDWEAHWDMPPVYVVNVYREGDKIYLEFKSKSEKSEISIDSEGNVRSGYDTKETFRGKMNEAKDRMSGYYNNEELYYIKLTK